MYDRFLKTVGECGRLVVYDRPGIGSSDPFDPERDWLEQMSDASVAVMDAAGVDAAWLIGAALVQFAVTIRTHPSRVLGAVLVNSAPRQRFTELLQSSVGRDRSPAVDLVPSRADDAQLGSWLRRADRLGASASDRAEFMSAQRQSHERFVAAPRPVVDGPPIRLIRRRESMGPEDLAWWTGIYPDAEVVTIEGADSGMLGLDAGLVAELAAGFISGRPAAPSVERHLVAVLFTDLVDSTPTALARGDAVWRSLLDRYERTLRQSVQRHHGALIKHTGDGAVATFPSGSQALAASLELRSATRELGLEGRTGVHVGEVERRGEDIGGIAVNLTARVMGEAEPGDVLVTASVNDTTQGGRFTFSDLGARTLKGIDRPCRIFRVEHRAPR